MSRTAWVRIGTLCTVAVFLVTGNFLFGWLIQSSRTTFFRYDDVKVSRLVVHLSAGSLSVLPGTPGEIRASQELRWALVRPVVTRHWDQARQTLTLDVVCHGRLGLAEHCSASFSLFVPPQVAVQADAMGGDITVQNIQGDLELSSAGGDVRAYGTKGSVDATSTGGDVVVESATSASVTATSAAGQVNTTFLSAPTTVLARSTAGDVQVEVPRGTAYAVSKAGSNVIHDLGEVPDTATATRKITADSVAGNVWVNYAS